MQNMGSIDYCRTSTAVASGCTAGILGLTGIYGFIFYFIIGALMSVRMFYGSGICLSIAITVCDLL